jgi:flagellar hook-basal body complex protein FliE
MSDINIQNVLAQMRTLSIDAGAKPQAVDSGSDFAAMLKQSIDTVNQHQHVAGNMANDFEMGKPDVSLAEVMVASQKASVSFQAMLQVRNKLVDAYKDVMSMPI